ncbi:acylphosphatase [Aerococcus mictus]|nr:acylphosphatase [Aerococcus mictus]PKY81743.1 acylphosphatase [Aerococcus mictus]PMB92894.1 acylphosphatase [Aerococcus mictus]RAV62761.1 acylphosphatase [Aerococcus mictus]RAV73658.1 acylphosphatase [Aerococcus mictus]
MGDDHMLTSKIQVQGRVQGVGFRFHVTRLANKLQLTGTVKNESDGSVTIQLQADESQREHFITELQDPKNIPYARIDQLSVTEEKDLPAMHDFHPIY